MQGGIPMNGIGNWFRQLGYKMKTGLQRFMMGRYGTDKLNTVILFSAVILCFVAMLIPVPLVKLVLTVASYGLMFWAIFRTLSRNTYKRYRENRKYLMFIDRIKDREHRYYDCPKCRQLVRVPRGKGKIMITCPKCKEKFQKKT
jgi:ribosomal protein L37AE/L43A